MTLTKRRYSRSGVVLLEANNGDAQGFGGCRWLLASGDAGRFGPAGANGIAEWSNSRELSTHEIPSGQTDNVTGFLKIQSSRMDAVGSGAASAPRPTQSTRHPPMQQIEGFFKPALRNKPSAGSGVACWRAVGRGRWHQPLSIHPHPFSIQKSGQAQVSRWYFNGNKAPGSLLHRPSRLDPRLASRRHRSPPAAETSRSRECLYFAAASR
jgi:hypothetical protein